MMPEPDLEALVPVGAELRVPLLSWIESTCSAFVPPLYYSDIAGLAMLRVEVELQKRRGPTNPRRHEFAALRRDALLVLWLTARPLLECGEFWPPGDPEPPKAHAFARQAIDAWDREILALVEARMRGDTWLPGSREEHLSDLYVEINRQGFVSNAHILRQGAVGIRTRGVPSHTGEETIPVAVAAELKVQWLLGKEARLFAVGSDGLFRIDVRGLRDQGRRSKRQRKTELLGDPEAGTGVHLASGSANDARAAVDAVQATDDARKVREVIAARLAELAPRSSAWHCVSNACALLTGELSVAALAREIGAGSRAMQKSWKAESLILRDRLQAALGA